MNKTFRIQSSLRELSEHFGDKKNAVLRVHVCTNGQVIGTATVNLLPLFCNQEAGEFEGRMSRGEYVVCAANKQGKDDVSEAACCLVMLCLDKEHKVVSKPRVCSSISLQTDLAKESSERVVDCATSPIRPAKSGKHEVHDNADTTFLQQKLCEEKERELKAREAQISKKEQDLEKKRCEWEQWRHEEEFKWHERLRVKEAATMRTIEDRMCQSRSEYEKLEGRLRNALIEVEAKERHLKEVEVTHQNERKRKMAELELREKAMNHSLAIEASL